MKTYYTGTTGNILFNGNTLTDVAEWSIETDQSIVETTTLGDAATTFRYSRPSYSGSLTILASEGSNADIELVTEGLMRTPFSPQPAVYDLFLITKGNKLFTTIRCQALFESVGYESRPGEIIAATLSFRANGLLTEYGWNGPRSLELHTGQLAVTFNPIVLRYDVQVINTLAIAVTANDITFRRQRLELDAGVFDIAFVDIPLIPSFALASTLEIDIDYLDQELVKDSIIEPAVLDIEIDTEDQNFDRVYIMALDAGVFSVGFNDISLNPLSFDLIAYNGNGTTQTFTSLGFEPGFVWIQRRDTTTSPTAYSIIRPANTYWFPSATNAEATSPSQLTSFNASGFSISNASSVNANTGTYIAWCWPNPGTTTTNATGSLTTTGGVDLTLGVSIFTYTGNGTTGATIGHGLGADPDLFIIKRLSSTGGAQVGGVVMDLSSGYQVLNTTAARASATTIFQGTSSTVITLGTSTNVNGSGSTYICYAFKSRLGFSKFATYIGSGATDTTVTTGFAPRYVLVKSRSATGSWLIFDSARGVTQQLLHPTGTESTVDKITFDANGFTVKANADTNTSSVTYIYMAFR
jgi:hypothetical protein